MLQPEVVRRVQLKEKLVYARDLSLFINRLGGTHQTVEAAQKTSITLVLPAQLLRAAPARAAGPVEPAVIADSKEGIGGDDVVGQCQFSQCRPGIETGRIARGNGIKLRPIDCRRVLSSLESGERRSNLVGAVIWIRRQHNRLLKRQG